MCLVESFVELMKWNYFFKCSTAKHPHECQALARPNFWPNSHGRLLRCGSQRAGVQAHDRSALQWPSSKRKPFHEPLPAQHFPRLRAQARRRRHGQGQINRSLDLDCVENAVKGAASHLECVHPAQAQGGGKRSRPERGAARGLV